MRLNHIINFDPATLNWSEKVEPKDSLEQETKLESFNKRNAYLTKEIEDWPPPWWDHLSEEMREYSTEEIEDSDIWKDSAEELDDSYIWDDSTGEMIMIRVYW